MVYVNVLTVLFYDKQEVPSHFQSNYVFRVCDWCTCNCNTYSHIECTLSTSQKDVRDKRNNSFMFLSHVFKTFSLFFLLKKNYNKFIFHLNKKRNLYVCITREQNSNKPPKIYKMPNYKERENILI